VKSRVPQGSRVGQLLQSRHLCAVALVAAIALLLVPAGASAASPVLEFVVPGNAFPVSFSTESGPMSAEMVGFSSLVHCTASRGTGKITGARSTVSEYQFTGCRTEKGSNQECKTESAGTEEITTGPIEADLVYIDRASDEVGMLLNPGGGTYISFECGGEKAEGTGPFLAPVSPINRKALSFAAVLNQSESMQTPDEYEGPFGELLKAIPMGKRGSHGLVATGVEATFAVHTTAPVEVKATAQEVEAEQHDEETLKHEEALEKQEEALQTLETNLKKQEEALRKSEEHAKQLAGEAKRHEEEASAQLAATVKRYQEEAAATKKQLEAIEAKTQSPTRAQRLSKALKQCKKQPKKQQARCVAAAHRKYGART
jgi:hypothetical protein